MLKIRFKLIETSLKNFYLYCLVRVNQKAAKSAIATGIRLEKEDWDPKGQAITNMTLLSEIVSFNKFRNKNYLIPSEQKHFLLVFVKM